MSFLYESRTYSSEKNGEIKCFRLLGQWNVLARGCGQTTSYTNTMWKDALKRIPQHSGVKRVLMLGLGAGGMIGSLRNRLGKCSVTVIEWDPVMAQIAKDLGKHTGDCKIIIGDAYEELPRLEEKFDLVIVDMFQGSKVSSVVHQESFISALCSVLDHDGYLLLNVFREPELLSRFDLLLSKHSSWSFQANTLTLYRHFGKGRIGDPLPSGYISYKQSLEYLRSNWSPWSNVSTIGKENACGIRWNFGRVAIESYETDEEPAILPGPARMIIWQPLTRIDAPDGWFRSWIQMNFKRTGFAEIINAESYWESWANHAKRHRRKWFNSQPYLLEETLSTEEFIASYQKSPNLRMLKSSFASIVRQHKKFHKDFIHLFVAIEKTGGAIVAGLAVIDLPDINQSHHLISFVHPQAKSSSVGTGLIDCWFQRAVSNNI